ncbi:MAG TPA: formylglycine-generating enzyme family protein [Candidatus Cloacimonadota bacterium]|nr:formylglycine-generating enzyme family protein [Candidatus Cloacimonadota bacterium]HPT71042.1 formylglycine-generating enzyme family protein [Candidatus Cloacimonadota bacterium]
MKQLWIIILISFAAHLCFAVQPVVTNSSASQRTDGSKIVDIYYDVSDAEHDSVYVTLKLSFDGGSTFTFSPTMPNLSGDINKIPVGTGKHIIWNAGNEGQNFDGSQFAMKIQAWNTIPVPTNFAFVQGGTFTMGNTYGNSSSDGLLHQVTLTSYYIDKYEVTQQEWLDVMGTNPSHFTGNLSRPVEQVSWYAAIAYCNKRSMMEYLTPCYTYEGYGTNPDDWPAGWNSGAHNNFVCNFNDNGYRLPTESEWEYAAKGGNLSHNYQYSGSNNLSLVAWYYGNSTAQTHAVSALSANELAAYDMSGNVWEWCWDWYDGGYYSVSPTVNPTGPETGSFRVDRGGSWGDGASLNRVALRNLYTPSGTAVSLGFRLARSLP